MIEPQKKIVRSSRHCLHHETRTIRDDRRRVACATARPNTAIRRRIPESPKRASRHELTVLLFQTRSVAGRMRVVLRRARERNQAKFRLPRRVCALDEEAGKMGRGR